MASLRCVRSSRPADDRGSVSEFRGNRADGGRRRPFNVFRLSAGERRIATSRDNHYAGSTHATQPSSCGGAADLTVDGCISYRRVPMSISPTLYKYLAAENIQYDEIPHELTMTSSRTAEACHVSGDRLAKAIVLRRDGGYILAVLPASHRLRMPELKAKLGDDIDMASEHEVNQLFADCARGAVPAAGACYGLDVVVDHSIQTQPANSRNINWRKLPDC